MEIQLRHISVYIQNTNITLCKCLSVSHGFFCQCLLFIVGSDITTSNDDSKKSIFPSDAIFEAISNQFKERGSLNNLKEK